MSGLMLGDWVKRKQGDLMSIILGDYRMQGDRIIMSVPCERCSTIVGDLGPDEVVALLSGKYGRVLCFDCEEESCPSCQKELTLADKRELEVNGGVCWFCQEEERVPSPGFIPDWSWDGMVVTEKGLRWLRAIENNEQRELARLSSISNLGQS